MNSQKNTDTWDNRAIILLFITISLVWGRRLSESLSLDETLTYWITGGSLGDTFTRSFYYQAQPPLYYFLIDGVRDLLGDSELFLRLPSFLLGIGSIFFIGGFVSRTVSPFAALICVFTCIVSDGGIFLGTSARPYALQLFFSSGALYLLTLEKRSYPFIIACFLQLLGVFTHYVSVSNLIPMALYLLFVSQDSKSSKGTKFLALLISSAVPLISSLTHLQFLTERSSEISISGTPAITTLIIVLLQFSVLSLFLIAYLTGSSLKTTAESTTKSQPENVLLFSVLWYLLPPLGLFAISYLSHSSTLFAERYLLTHIGSLGLLFGVLTERLSTETKRTVFLLIYLCLALIADQLKELRTDDWRGVATSLSKDSRTEIFLYSGLVETRAISFLRDKQNSGYLGAPLTSYGISQNLHHLPFSLTNEESVTYLEELLDLAQVNETLRIAINKNSLLGGESPAEYYKEIFLKNGWNKLSEKDFGSITILELTQTDFGSSPASPSSQ